MSARYMTADDVSDLFADERKRLTAEHEGDLAELRAEVADLREQVKTLESLRPLLNVLHAELLRSDRVEHYPQGDDAPAMLKIGRATLFGIAADPLLEALRSAALDFTDDKED